MPAYDYSVLADLYDDFCVFAEDIEFFRGAAAAARGPVLELMAGTGRAWSSASSGSRFSMFRGARSSADPSRWSSRWSRRRYSSRWPGRSA